MLRIPHCLDNRFIDGGWVVSLNKPAALHPQKSSGTRLSLRQENSKQRSKIANSIIVKSNLCQESGFEAGICGIRNVPDFQKVHHVRINSKGRRRWSN
jgi:hypothetical protein